MNKLMFVGAAVAALLATPAMAADMPVKAPPQTAVALQPSGYIELYTGSGRFRDTFCDVGFGCDPGISDNGWTIGGAGRGNWWLTQTLSLQLDAQAEGTQYKIDTFGCTTCGDKESVHGYDIAAHLAARDPRGAVGLVGAVGDVSPGVRFAAIGGEGLGNWGMITLYLQGGYGTTVGRNETIRNDIDGGFARGTLRFYPSQTFLIEGTVMGAWLTMSPFNPGFASTDVQSALWRVKAEAMLNPWLSVYVAYQGSRTQLDTGIDPICCGLGSTETMRDDRVLIGVRAWLNRDNLRNNDITGAPFDFINPLGFFGPTFGLEG